MKKALLKKLLLFGKIFFGLILVLVIILSVFPLMPPFKNYYHSRTVLTGSMEPKIPKGSVVINQWTDQKNLKVDDVITYQHPSDKKINYITHRIVKIDKTGLLWRFETKGDANPAPDFGLITQAGTEGKVIFTIPLIGYLIEFFKTPVGFILLIALPLLIFIVWQIRDVLRLWQKRVIPQEDIPIVKKRKSRKTLAVILVALAFLATRVSFVTYASFTSGQTTITGVTLSTAGDWTPPSASLSVTGSFTKSVTEKITNGDFESGLTGWTKAGKVVVLSTDTINDAAPSSAVTVTPVSGLNMVVIGKPTHSTDEDDATSGNYVWENRLMGSFDSGVKSLSLQYNFFTRDFSPFDNPGFFVRLNGQEIFKLNTLSANPTDENDGLAYNTGWSEFYYDLSNHNDSKVNLGIYGGNTGDQDYQSWVYIDEITTYFVSAPSHAIYILSGEDNLGGSGINHYEYDIDGAGWLTGNTFGGVPPLSDGGTHTVQYRSVDNAGNSSPVYTVRIITDTVAPADIADFRVDEPSPDITENSVLLTWTALGNDGLSGRASQYDLRYSISPIINDLAFEAATKVDKVPSPKNSGEEETLEVTGLNPSTTYYFAIKAADEAPNWSGISNVVLATTLSGATVNAGDVVINELMWMGSVIGSGDEWIEIRNMTGRTIDLSNWQITKWVAGTHEELMLTIPFDKKIPANGYFLISNFTKDTSAINVEPDLVDSGVVLTNDDLRIKLYKGIWTDSANLIDEVWNNTEPKEGYYEVNSKYYSMERTSVPGDGSDPLNWYTCIDGASTADFFDSGADERGTPGVANRSENEPLANQSFILRVTPTLETSPTPIPTAEPLTAPELLSSPSATLDSTSTPEPSPTVEPTPAPSMMPSPSPEPSPEVSPTPTPEPTSEPTSTLTPTPSPTSEL